MSNANFHLAGFFFLLSLKSEIFALACQGSGEKPGCSLCICKSYNAFPSDHWKHVNCFLGNKLFSKRTLMQAETHQPNMVKCEHIFGSEMKQWVIFCRIFFCQGVNYLLEGSNFKMYQFFFKQWMLCYSSVKSSRNENHSIKVNVNSDSGYKRNRFAVANHTKCNTKHCKYWKIVLFLPWNWTSKTPQQALFSPSSGLMIPWRRRLMYKDWYFCSALQVKSSRPLSFLPAISSSPLPQDGLPKRCQGPVALPHQAHPGAALTWLLKQTAVENNELPWPYAVCNYFFNKVILL